MKMTKKFEVIAKIGEYDSGDGKKARWRQCGVVFEDESGKLSLKLDSIPIATEWNGWFTFSKPENSNYNSNYNSRKETSKPEARETVPVASSPQNTAVAADKKVDEDDLPF